YRPYTLEEYVGMLRAFLDEIGARQAALVGNCVGSAIAYRFALQWPERVEKLVLFNVLTEDTLAGGFLGLLVRATAPATGLRKAVRWLCGPVRVPRPVARWIVGKQMRPATGPVAERLVGLYRQRAQVKALLDILVDLDSYERIDRARGCKGLPPAMLLWGARNEVLPLERGKQLAGRLGLQLEVLPGGHLVMLECPQAVNERLRRFLCS
ncbi:MAG: alpha/beta hydrolase, partial [Candidatus Dadabacteria bacterium]